MQENAHGYRRIRKDAMGKYEPRDSRIVTQNPSTKPIEPERTGPHEGETRKSGRQLSKSDGQTDSASADDDSEKDRWQVARGQ